MTILHSLSAFGNNNHEDDSVFIKLLLLHFMLESILFNVFISN